jgi:hypothetical protein
MKLTTGRRVEKVRPLDWIKACPQEEFAEFVITSLRKQTMKALAATC